MAMPRMEANLQREALDWTELQNVKKILHRSFLSNQIYPKKKRVNRDKFFTFRVSNGHKKQTLGQKYQKSYLEGCFEEKCHCSC